ncbi:MAG: hypothetical protein DI571_12725 [Arsenicicoccus sp.]|nr:MAG: hypothetical protein DI571_12725 [Arsenicicoccus sp.]
MRWVTLLVSSVFLGSMVGLAAAQAFDGPPPGEQRPPSGSHGDWEHQGEEITNITQLSPASGYTPVGDSRVSTYPYPENALGLTYGSSADAPDAGIEPDLILTVADDGSFGYVYADRIVAPTRGTDEPSTLTVYAQDGVTKIGVVTLDPRNQ